MKITFLFLLVLLSGCTGCASGMGAADIIKALELTECEIGDVSIEGDVKLGSGVWGQGSLHISMREVHTAEDVPADCPAVRE